MAAKGDSDYSPDKIREALALVVANHGNIAVAAREADVPKTTLQRWVSETKTDEYAEVDRQIGQSIEDRVRRQALVAAEQAVETELDLLDKLSQVQPRELPAALQAVAAVKDKAIGKYLALSGRPVDGHQGGPAQLIAALHHLEKKGLLKINVDIGEPPVDSTAEEIAERSS